MRVRNDIAWRGIITSYNVHPFLPREVIFCL